MLERTKQRLGGASRDVPASVHRSFGAWNTVDPNDVVTVQVCHPQWRGVRTSAYAFGDPVIETSHLETDLADEMRKAGVRTVIIHASPPGSKAFIRYASALGLSVMQVIHSSMAQHGTDAGEAEAVSDALAMQAAGDLTRVGFVKIGVAEVFQHLGYQAFHVPNRTPQMPDITTIPLGNGLNIGVFHDPYWRKNVTTQLGAAALMGGTAHVMSTPDVAYLSHMSIVEHGTLPWEHFVSLQASVDINLYVTLAESHPMSPIESYLTGVPCLVSRTSDLFLDDDELRELTTIAELDDPSAIARSGERLLASAPLATERANAWIVRQDRIAQQAWSAFTSA
ncbi:MAG: hypothetical protein M3132_10850 [Actinomycetia bacterium]|nr:hypothetical protein [Actinomycetes bacterium]